jgi:Alpha/beta hydrolase family
MRWRRWLLIAIVLVLTSVAGVAGYWLQGREKRLSPVDPVALTALQSSAQVTVTQSSAGWHVFKPANVMPRTGFIFYPGGECDERGYAELLHAIAAEGFLVVLVPMPLQLAVLAPNRADAVIDAFPAIERWAIGGHSLGGAMAARYVYEHPDAVQGLLFWDAYPPKSDDLSDYTGRVRLIHRSDASGAPPDYYAQYVPLLPADMDYRALPGGIHINFGRFIPAERFRQAETAMLPIDAQHALIVRYTAEFLAVL